MLILRAACRPDNCLELLRLAHSCCCPQLQAQCLKVRRSTVHISAAGKIRLSSHQYMWAPEVPDGAMSNSCGIVTLVHATCTDPVFSDNVLF